MKALPGNGQSLAYVSRGETSVKAVLVILSAIIPPLLAFLLTAFSVAIPSGILFIFAGVIVLIVVAARLMIKLRENLVDWGNLSIAEFTVCAYIPAILTGSVSGVIAFRKANEITGPGYGGLVLAIFGLFAAAPPWILGFVGLNDMIYELKNWKTPPSADHDPDPPDPDDFFDKAE